MPVVGHAFVGIVTAHAFEPGGQRLPERVGPVARALWMPVLVGLAYLPDVVTQLGLALGYASAKSAGHSLLFAVVAGALFGRAWARLTRTTPRPLVALAVGSILLHDLLDLVQDLDRAPLWPLTDRVIAADSFSIPNRLWTELLVLGVPCAIYELRRFYSRSRAGAHPRADDPSTSRAAARLAWVGHGLVVMVLVSAVTVQQMRRERRVQMRTAEELLRSARFSEALKAVDGADRWPSASGPGRVDLIRGEAWEGLGDRARALRFFLRACDADPENFWAVASLAEFYASEGTAAQRRQRAAPYVEQLRRRFATHRSLPVVIRRVERKAAKVTAGGVVIPRPTSTAR